MSGRLIEAARGRLEEGNRLLAFGAVFDWDGVVIDSSAHHQKAWEWLAAEEGRMLSRDHFGRGFGLKNERIIPDILCWTDDEGEIQRLSMRKEELYRNALRGEGVSLLPGVATLLSALRERGIPCAVGSSTHRENIDTALALLELGRFDALVTGEDVSLGKPDPEVFLLAAQRIAVAPARCVVFEDAPAGIEAAHRGGMMAVGVTTTHAATALADADIVVDRLDQLSPASLEKLLDNQAEPQKGRIR